MDQDTYMKNRIDDQIAWYDRRSGDFQRQYKRYRIIEIVCASMIPFLTGFMNNNLKIQILIGTLGIIIAIASALDALIQPQQLWTEYRSTSEKLKQEKYLFETNTSPYNMEENFQEFVENAEAILAGENSRWLQNKNKQAKERLQSQDHPNETPAPDKPLKS